MSSSIIQPVVSNASTQFTNAIAAGAADIALVNLPMPLVGAKRVIARGIKVIAKENWGPQINFFGSATGPTADPATDSGIGWWGFTSGMGVQFGGAGLWRYYIDGLAIPLTDGDWLGAAGAAGQPPNSPSLHILLSNLGVNNKSAGAAGSTKVIVYCEAVQGW